MPRATVDIPFINPLGIPPGPDPEQRFTAVVMAVCGLLIDHELITREELETRVIGLLDNPELMEAADLVESVSWKLAARAIEEKMRKDKAAKEEAERNRPPAPLFTQG